MIYHEDYSVMNLLHRNDERGTYILLVSIRDHNEPCVMKIVRKLLPNPINHGVAELESTERAITLNLILISPLLTGTKYMKPNEASNRYASKPFMCSRPFRRT